MVYIYFQNYKIHKTIAEVTSDREYYQQLNNPNMSI